MNLLASSTACVLHVPYCPTAGMTQSPFWRSEDPPPVETTSKTPSFPGTTEGSAVPSKVVKGGFDPYVPWMVLMSAGLIGAARDRTRTDEEGIDGEMEWVWTLISISDGPQVTCAMLSLTSRRPKARHSWRRREPWPEYSRKVPTCAGRQSGGVGPVGEPGASLTVGQDQKRAVGGSNTENSPFSNNW